MLITLTCPVRVLDNADGTQVVDPAMLVRIAGYRIPEPELVQCMDDALDDLGLVDAGIVFNIHTDSKILECTTSFRAIEQLRETEIVALANYLADQFLDGWGEGGIQLSLAGKAYHAEFQVEAGQTSPLRGFTIQQVSDGKPVPDRRPSPLIIAARDGDFSRLSAALATGGDIDALDKWGQTPLDTACATGHVGIARLLLSAGARPGANAIAICAMRGHVEILVDLLAAGAPVDEAREDDINPGMTPLMWAANRGHLDAIRLLIKNGARVDAQDARGRTALMLTHELAVVDHLLSAGANPGIRETNGLDAVAYHLSQAASFERIDDAVMAEKAMSLVVLIRERLRKTPL